MPFTYRIDPEAGLVFVTAIGTVPQAERLATMNAWLNDPLFRPGLDMFCDFSESTSPPTLDELRAIAQLVERHAAAIGRLKIAVLATKVVTFGVARQFQAMSAGGPLDVRVFSDPRTAWNWLRGTDGQPS